jgi:CDP-4-dehydro-6-deoxyglucose reductase, E3
MKISINSNVVIDAIPEKTILQSAKFGGITINHSCLNGRCSECKVKVLSGNFFMPNNQEGLKDKEVNDGYCLSCISRPETDLVLDEVKYFDGILPEEKIIPAKISKLKYLSEKVIKMTLRTPPNNKLNFLAGQYVDLSIGSIKRSYSIASAPCDSQLEFIIKNYSNGEFSNYLFNQAKLNDLLRIEGPKGTYVFPKKTKENIVFLSTGTGIAPNISLIKFALESNLLQPNQITLIHGQKWVSDHNLELINALDGCNVILTVSRESSKGYFRGYVQDALLKRNLDLNRTQVFACGNPNMITQTKNILFKMGLPEIDFKSDIFVKSN